MSRTMSLTMDLQERVSELLKPHRVCLVKLIGLNHSTQPEGRSENGVLVLSLWRGFLVISRPPARVESSFSYLEISAINIYSLTQVVLETDRQTFSFSVSQIEDLEAMVSHMTASLKKIFPDSSPRKLLKKIPPDLQERLQTLTSRVEEQLELQPGHCGGFSDTYAALCDFNDTPCKEEIQWDVDNIYHVHNWREFNFLHFSHLESRDLALAVAALSSNQWFTRIYSKELKLSAEIQEQFLFLLSRSPSLEELSLEASGLKLDFAVKMAAAIQDHTSSALHSINLSANHIEDKGVIALSQELGNLTVGLRYLSLSRVSMSARGLGCLSHVLSTSQLFSGSLTHLDLSGNPGSLATEEATSLFRFLSSSNSLFHLDLSGTDCPLDTLFVSLSAGCISKLSHLNLAKNPFSHRKVREVTRSIREFFSQSCELKYVGLSATKLPPQALRLLLQGLATNTSLCGLKLDLSSCELHSSGAQVIQEHIFEAKAISSLDISDNGFESDMVTLVLSLGRCYSLRHLALGKNFPMKSRALTDVLQRIVQLLQDEECALESLSVCDSKLKTGATILINSLGSDVTLAQVDLSGNSIGDTGAKILAKALLTNTKLRTLVWDRNNVTARGFQDVADALERNFTLQQMSLPLADVTQGYRSNPERTEVALHKIQQCLQRNNQRHSEGRHLHQQGLRTQHSTEKEVQGLCRQLEDSLQTLTPYNNQEVRADFLSAEEVLSNARKSLRLLPSLYELGRSPSGGDMVNCILTDTATALTNEITGDIQELAQAMLTCAEGVCPRVVQRSSVCERLAECVTRRSRQTGTFLRSTLVEHTGQIISNKLCEVRQSLCGSLVESIIEQVLQDLSLAQSKLDCHIRENSCPAQRNNIPQLRLDDHDFPTDDYIPVTWRNSFLSKSLRPAPSVKSLLDGDGDQHARETGDPQHPEQPHGARGGELSDAQELKEGGGGGGGGGSANGRGLPRSPTATLLSVAAPGPSPSPSSSPSPSPASSPSPSPSPSPRERRRRRGRGREGEAAAAAAAVSGARGASVSPPPGLPPVRSSVRAADEEEEATGGCGGLTRREAPFPGRGPSPGPLPGSGSPGSHMELLPTQGQALRHYTASRPRPRRTRTQPPSSRPQEPVSETENEANEGMGRVDEGVEEFFTKKILPDYALKGRWEESNPAQATPSESSSTPSALTPFSSSSSDNITSSTTSITPSTVPASNASLTHTATPANLTSSSVTPPTSSNITSSTTTPPSKNIKKKFGDFFAFKKARASRAAKAGGGEGGGGGEGAKVKRTSIADLIRPLREAKEREREREREREKEREKERETRSVEDVNVSNDAAVTEGTVAASDRLPGDRRDETAHAMTVTATTPPSEAARPSPAAATSPDLASALSSLGEEVATSLPVQPDHTPSPVAAPPAMTPSTEQEKSRLPEKERRKGGGTPDGERRLKVTRRSLREGKSQSLILLTGLEPEDKDTAHSKHASESTSSFEQRLQVMLHRMGVAKTPPVDTKTNQNKDDELRKANSEGAILDKPEAPPTFMKPRTMSTSSDTRRPMRAVDPLRPDPPSLHPKPVLAERPVGLLPPKPLIAAKPPLPAPPGPRTTAPATLQQPLSAPQHLPSPAPHTASPGAGQPLRPTALHGKAEEAEASKTHAQNDSQAEPLPQVAPQKDTPPPASAPPAPSPRRGPSAQDRSEKAQSVTDESLPKPRPRMKPLPQRRAVSVHEDTLAMTQELKAVLQRSPIRHRGNRGDLPTCTEDTPTGQEVFDGGERAGKAEKRGERKEEKEREKENRDETKTERGSSEPLISAARDKPPLPSVSPALGLEKPQSTQGKPPAPAPGPSPAPSTTQALPQAAGKPQATPSIEKAPSTMSTAPVTAELGNSTQEREETVSRQHIAKAEPPDQRTEPPLSE
ncbi:capping protein, Arp2/3 and myosin-I linker protein 2 isoform 3-T3 [Polymixia lowei]